MTHYHNILAAVNRCGTLVSAEPVQTLWSGYGEIVRLHLHGGDYPSVILKHIRLPQPENHPRGWNSDLSHQRKIKSYKVEAHWYQRYAPACTLHCPVPTALSVTESHTETLLLLTDLSAEGFCDVKSCASEQDIHACLSWLAHFHATFLTADSEGLWTNGTYWHLDTRPDELVALDDPQLQRAAPVIDRALKQSRYQTLVHGDAKLANFCFAAEPAKIAESPVAAVDFQYVGGGCGMKDVAYFLGSCLSDDECEKQEEALLSFYFKVLTEAVARGHPGINVAELEQEWRSLFDVAWADFHRFLKGWSPGHWKLNSYSEQLTQRVIQRLL